MAAGQGTTVLAQTGAIRLYANGSRMLSNGSNDCGCCGDDTTPCVSCSSTPIVIYTSNGPYRYFFDGSGYIIPPYSGIYIGNGDFSAYRSENSCSDFYIDGSGYWAVDIPYGSGYVTLRQNSTSTYPRLGRNSIPPSWDIYDNTSEYTIFGGVRSIDCKGTYIAPSRGLRIFVSGIINNFYVDNGPSSIDLTYPTWDGYLYYDLGYDAFVPSGYGVLFNYNATMINNQLKYVGSPQLNRSYGDDIWHFNYSPDGSLSDYTSYTRNHKGYHPFIDGPFILGGGTSGIFPPYIHVSEQ